MARKVGKTIESYDHSGSERLNNPPVGLVKRKTDPESGSTDYSHDPSEVNEHDPHIDPELSWAEKDERENFTVPTVSLYVHERIDPRSIIQAVQKPEAASGQGTLFTRKDLPLHKAIEFYKHSQGWSNRLIAGDSLLVMNSLLEKENLGGGVQMIYIDPPYGMEYGSNFQPFAQQREVTDGKDEHLTREPETIKAFRDAWGLGIHSYLNYLRDRLLLARELLTESGSCFVQIGDENVHRVALMMDEIFGAENRLATITFATASGSSTKHLPEVGDYLLWYAKDGTQCKYHQLYEKLTRSEIVKYFSSYAGVELSNGEWRRLTSEEHFDPDYYLPEDSRLFQAAPLLSQGYSTTGRSEPFTWNDVTYQCPDTLHWSVSHEGLERLAARNRLHTFRDGTSLRWKKYEEEIPGRRINNLWHRQMYPSDKRYVVQTSRFVIQRCMLMTTDPGDLVFDPTCGSGTTAYIAEQWGRRWITCDTSRVALNIARQRLMTATFDYYSLAQPNEGVDSGFKYKTVPKVSAAILAYDEPPQFTTLYDQPERDPGKHRVTGPFTVEAVPSPTVLSIEDNITDEFCEQIETSEPPSADNSIARTSPSTRQTEWISELLATGIRGKAGQRIRFTRLEPLSSTHLAAVGEAFGDDPSNPEEGIPHRVAVVFGPEHAPLVPKQVERALEEAATHVPQPDLLIFAAFQFDPEAAKDIDETNWPGTTLLRAEMNTDLQTDDLKKGRTSNESFWLIGQPEIEISALEEQKYQVSVLGFDYFSLKSGEHIPGGENQIAVWLLDTDYNGRSLFPRQVFFPLSKKKHGWEKLGKALRSSIDRELIKAYEGTTSLPFEAGEHNRVAVKIVDDRGIESLALRNLGERA